MKAIFNIIFILLLSAMAYGQRGEGQINVRGEKIAIEGDKLHIDLIIDVRTVKINSADALVLIPEVVSGNRSKELPRVVLNGKKRHKIFLREQAMGIESYAGDIYNVFRPDTDPAILDYSVVLPYESWMESASLRMRQETCGCPGEKKVLADNVLVNNLFGKEDKIEEVLTAAEPSAEETTLFVDFMEPRKEEIKARSEYGEAYLNFIVAKSDILYDYKDNARKLDQVQAFFKRAQDDKNIVLDGISIIGYASPEGTYDYNMDLSGRRATAFANWVQNRFRFPQNILTVDWRGEDWEKLRDLVEDSYMSEKYQILNIIDNYSIFEGRETKLMNLNGGRTYNYLLENLFPQLRRTYYRIDYTVRPFTAEESREIIKEKPQQLSVFEMYEAAHTYRRGSREFNNAMQKAAELFPEDPAAKTNAAAVALQEGRLDEAEKLLSETVESPTKQNNLGVLYMLKGDTKKAKEAFTKALQGGISDARHNLEIVSKQEVIDRQKQAEEQRRRQLREQEEAKQRQLEEQKKREESVKQRAIPYLIK